MSDLPKVGVQIIAEHDQADAGLAGFSESVKKLGLEDLAEKFKKLSEQAGKLGEATGEAGKKTVGGFAGLGGKIQEVGLSLTKTLSPIGITLIGIGSQAAKTAIAFETSFAGVKKTVQATEEEFKQLEAGFRALATQIPVSVNELNRIGETAGQLGIAREALLDFTKTVAAMSVSTNLTSDAAANAFARISSIMGVAAGDFERLGSTVVDLGNKGASTETEIVGMALRIAGAAKTVGFSTSELLGFSAGLANVGIRAEMGGTAMSNLLVRIAKAVSEGGGKLEGFARVAGMSGEQFGEAFRTNAAGAIASFLEGLGRMQRSGQDVFGTLDELHLKETRLRDTLLRLAASAEGFNATLQTGRAAWSENVALADEAGKRYATTQSQLELFSNKLHDLSLTLGQTLLPGINSMLQAMEPLIQLLAEGARWFGGLDTNVKLAAGSIVLAFAVGGPAVLAIGALVAAIGAIGAPIAVAVAAIGGLGAAGLVLSQNWERLKTEGRMIWEDIGMAISGAIATLRSNIVGGWEQTKGDLIVRWTQVKVGVLDVVSRMVQEIANWLGARLMAVFERVKAPIEAVKGYFRGLYDAVVGHSYVPDMVEEIGEHMRYLDVALVAPARNATRETGRIFEGFGFSVQESINQLATSINYAWGSMVQTTSGAVANMITSTNDWAQTGKQLANSFLTSMLTTIFQIMTQYGLSTIFHKEQDAEQLTSHGATETAKTALTVAQEKARTAIAMAETTAVFTAMSATVSAVVGLGSAVIDMIGAVGNALGGFLVAVGTALMAIPGAQAVATKVIGAGIQTLSATNSAVAVLSAGIAAAATKAAAAAPRRSTGAASRARPSVFASSQYASAAS